MKIRLLEENEIQLAINVAHEAYRTCLLPFAKAKEEVEQYNSYVNLENLWGEVHGQNLFLFGAFEAEELVGVSALQNTGHITMLYVRPAFQRRNCGSSLLDWMRGYAKETLRLKKVTVNAIPVFTASYFEKRGFRRIQGIPYPQTVFVALEAKVRDMPQIRPERKICWGAILGVSIGTLVLVFVIAFAYNTYEAVTREVPDRAQTQEFWEHEMGEDKSL